MALTLGILPIQFNLTTGKLKVENNSTGTPATTAAVIRILAPDGNYYYSEDNDEDTFADPESSATPDFTSNSGTNLLIDIPTAIDDIPQTGTYVIEMSASDGSDIYEMTPVSINYAFSTPVASVTQTLDCVLANLTSTDETDYRVTGIDPTITRTHSLTKDNDLPSPFTSTGSLETITLSYPNLYAGEYTSTLTSSLVYDFGTHIITCSITDTLAANSVECDRGICAIICGIKTLEMNLADAKANGNTVLTKTLESKLVSVAAYITLYNEAMKCGDTTSASGYILTIQKVGAFTSSCCEGEEDYQIASLGATPAALPIQFNGTTITTQPSAINFTGDGQVTEMNGSVVNVTIDGPSGIEGIIVSDEGTEVVADADSLNFVGDGVEVTLDIDGKPVITIPGGNATYGYNSDSGTTATNIAGVPAGTIFAEDALLKDVVYAILNPYQAPYFATLTSSLFTSYEVGQSLTSGNNTVSYTIANPTNIKTQPPAIGVPSTSISGATFPVNPVTLAASSSFIINIAASTTSNTPATKTISITGTDSHNAAFSATNSMSWLYRVYYGNSASATLNETGVEALSGQGLQSGAANTYGFTGSEYKYICIPDSFGTPSFFKDSSTGFAVAMATSSHDAFFSNLAGGFYYGTVSVTNAYGVTTTYRVYRSANQIVGLNIQVG